MQINRLNYEILVIDFLDGRLSSTMEMRLMQFLDDNPDLRDEMKDLLAFRLVPENRSFYRKENLKRGLSDIPENQFEYLCAAYFENDLSPDEEKEVLEMVERYPERGRSFSLIGKARLKNRNELFPHKRRLYREPPLRKISRYTVIMLTAAASMAVIVSLFVLLPGKTGLNSGKVSSLTPGVAIKVDNFLEIPEGRAVRISENIREQEKINRETISSTELPIAEKTTLVDPVQTERNEVVQGAEPVMPVAVQLAGSLELSGPAGRTELVAMEVPEINVLPETGTGKLDRFIARTFREKLLKEKDSGDSPLKGYEIAEAGVQGLNKLFGWEMALNEKTDSNGDLEYISFSSGILKFSGPVRKPEESTK